MIFLGALALLAPAPASAYPWPIKPFYQQHAIRGYFNDPRMSGNPDLPLCDRRYGYAPGIPLRAVMAE